MATEIDSLRFRNSIPDSHRKSIDTRIQWLWNQRFGTVQQVWNSSKDMLDHTAATLILQAVFAKDLESIAQVFQRIEGGAQFDAELDEQVITSDAGPLQPVHTGHVAAHEAEAPELVGRRLLVGTSPREHPGFFREYLQRVVPVAGEADGSAIVSVYWFPPGVDTL